MFFISQRDLGRDQTSPCRAWRSVPGQPAEGQHQPDSAGRASSAQVNTDSTTPPRSWVVWSPAAHIHTITTICFCFFNCTLVSHTHRNDVQTSFAKQSLLVPTAAISFAVRHSVRVWREICRVVLQHRGIVLYGRWQWQMVDFVKSQHKNHFQHFYAYR